MKLLVTGATGFLGANLVRHLLARGDEVVAVLRRPNLCTEGLPLTLRTTSLTDVEGLTRDAEGCAGIFHIAGTFDTSPEGGPRMQTLHVDATRALIEAGRRAGVPRFVYCSSSVTVGFGDADHPGDEDTPIDPTPIYGVSGLLRAYYETKREGEAVTRDAGGVVVCPDYVIGPWDLKPTSGELLLQIARGWVPVHPRGGKCFIDVGDCVIGHVRALEVGVPGRRYLLGNHNLSYRAFMTLCAEAAGTRPPVLPLPDPVARVGGLVGKALSRVDPHRFAGLNPNLLLATQQARYRSGRRSWEELGVPRTPMETSIRGALAWFRDHGYLDRRRPR